MALYDVKYRAEFDDKKKITRYAQNEVINGFLRLQKSRKNPKDKYFIIEDNSGKETFITTSEIYHLKGKNGAPGKYDTSFISRPLGAEVSDNYIGQLSFDTCDMYITIYATGCGVQKIHFRDLTELHEKPF